MRKSTVRKCQFTIQALSEGQKMLEIQKILKKEFGSGVSPTTLIIFKKTGGVPSKKASSKKVTKKSFVVREHPCKIAARKLLATMRDEGYSECTLREGKVIFSRSEKTEMELK